VRRDCNDTELKKWGKKTKLTHKQTFFGTFLALNASAHRPAILTQQTFRTNQDTAEKKEKADKKNENIRLHFDIDTEKFNIIFFRFGHITFQNNSTNLRFVLC
jgi:hypothetical protein